MRSRSQSFRSPYHQFIAEQPERAKRVLSLVEQGRTLLQSGHNDEARRCFLQALSVYPHVIPALNNLAFIALHEGDAVRALDIVQQVLDCDPHDPIAHALAVQCWYNRESDPMVRLHVEASLASYLALVKQGDTVDPEYPERAFPFVFQALLIAQDDQGIMSLHQAVPDRDWQPAELTWVGVAYFNRGRINEAHLIWRRVYRASRFEPARIYATLAQHVLSGDLLPFTLDYDLVLPDEDDDFPYTASTLALAQMINDVFRLGSKAAQETLVNLVEQDLPAQEFFLRRLVQNERLSPGVRMTAAMHLLWLSENEPLAAELAGKFAEQDLRPADKPVFYLLQATLAQNDPQAGADTVPRLLEAARQAAKAARVEWVQDYVDDMEERPWPRPAETQEEDDPEDDVDGHAGEDDMDLFRSLFPKTAQEDEAHPAGDEMTPKPPTSRSKTKDRGHRS